MYNVKCYCVVVGLWGGGGLKPLHSVLSPLVFYNFTIRCLVCLTIKKITATRPRKHPLKVQNFLRVHAPGPPRWLYQLKAEPSHFAKHSQLLSKIYTV